MKIIKNLVSKEKYDIKCPYEMEAEFIVVHNTANDAPAENEINYMISNDKEVSFHYAIDDEKIVQGIDEKRNAWHAGDGANGEGNRKGLAMEICYSKSGGTKFIAAEKLAAEFIASKLKEKNWGIDKVKKHQDFDRKKCPHRTLEMGWERFLNMVQDELNKLNKPADKTLYRVQCGAYTNKGNAETISKRIKAKGFDTYIVKVGKYYKIQVGAYSNKANANAMLAKIKAAGFSAFVTTNSGEAVSTPVQPVQTAQTIKAGDKVKVLKNIIYGTSNTFAVYYDKYDVIQVTGKRAVIGIGKVVTTAISTDNLIKL